MIFATIAGNIGKDAETRQAGGSTVTNFNVACESRVKGEKVTTWVRCAIWGKRGESLCRHLTKGGKVTVVGTLSTREYEGKTYLELEAADVALQGGRQDGGNRDDDRGNGGGSQGGYGGPSGDDADFIPFMHWGART